MIYHHKYYNKILVLEIWTLVKAMEVYRHIVAKDTFFWEQEAWLELLVKQKCSASGKEAGKRAQ